METLEYKLNFTYENINELLWVSIDFIEYYSELVPKEILDSN
jgi:hypothetical protein